MNKILFLILILLSTNSLAQVPSNLTTGYSNARQYLLECVEGKHGAKRPSSFRLTYEFADSTKDPTQIHTGMYISNNNVEIYFPVQSKSSTGRDAVLVFRGANNKPIIAYYNPTPYMGLPEFIDYWRKNVHKVIRVSTPGVLNKEVRDFLVSSILSFNRDIAVSERKRREGSNFYRDRYKGIMGNLRSEVLFRNQIRHVSEDGDVETVLTLRVQIERIISTGFKKFVSQ